MSTSTQCQENTTIKLVYYDYILPILWCIGLILTVPAVYMYAKHLRNDSKSTGYLLYYSAAFYVILVLYSIILLVDYSVYCHDDAIYFVTAVAANYCYAAQLLLFTTILFIKLLSIFGGTEFALSRLVAALYASLTIFTLLLGLSGISLLYLSERWRAAGYVMYGFSWLTAIAIIIWLNAMFIRKLTDLYKSSAGVVAKNDKLINSNHENPAFVLHIYGDDTIMHCIYIITGFCGLAAFCFCEQIGVIFRRLH